MSSHKLSWVDTQLCLHFQKLVRGIFVDPHFTNSIGLRDLDLDAQSPATRVLQTALRNVCWRWNTSSHTLRPILGSDIPVAICFLISFIILIFRPFSISRTCLSYLVISLRTPPPSLLYFNQHFYVFGNGVLLNCLSFPYWQEFCIPFKRIVLKWISSLRW